MARAFFAQWILPISSPPIHRGVVYVDGGRIRWLGPREHWQGQVLDLGAGVLMPGLVNAHTHLDLAALLPLDLGGGSFWPWFQGLIRLLAGLTPAARLEGAHRAISEALATGTTAIGEFSPQPFGALALAQRGLRGRFYLEFFGVGDNWQEQISAYRQRLGQAPRHERVGLGISPHALYSVGPRQWQALIQLAQELDLPLGTHLAESPEELEYCLTGEGPLSGPYRRLVGWGEVPVEVLGARPVQVLSAWGALSGLNLAHGVQITPGEMKELLQSHLVHCPRSNRFLGVGEVSWPQWRQMGILPALGTDSPLSGGSMDLWEEMRGARELARAQGVHLTSDELLQAATVQGARALGLPVGSFEIGKEADMILLHVPPGLESDLTDYLVERGGAELLMGSWVGGRRIWPSEKNS